MAKKQKYYVVWKGVNPGVYDSWTDCQLQIKGYDGAQYKSFETKEEAEHALASSAFHYIGKNAVKKEDTPKQLPENFDMNCLAVDAACSGNPRACPPSPHGLRSCRPCASHRGQAP